MLPYPTLITLHDHLLLYRIVHHQTDTHIQHVPVHRSHGRTRSEGSGRTHSGDSVVGGREAGPSDSAASTVATTTADRGSDHCAGTASLSTPEVVENGLYI